MNLGRLFVLVIGLLSLSSIAFGLTYEFDSQTKDVYYNPINITFNNKTNIITAKTDIDYKITNALSTGLIDQVHYINVTGLGIKLVYLNAETSEQSVYDSFKYFKKICVDNRKNVTHEYIYQNNLTSKNETREYVVEEGSLVCDWVEGNSWNSTGEFKLTYKTPIVASGKVDLTVCVNDQCETIDPWYDANYLYKKAIIINKNQILSTLTNFPILVRLNSSNFNFSRTQADGDDIRFVNGSENTALDYETVSYNQAGQTAEIYVEVPSIGTANDTVIYMYYGYGSAVSGSVPANVWDSNYVGIYHLQSDTTSSTSGGTTLTVANAETATGSGCYMGGCYLFSGDDTLYSAGVMGLLKTDSGRTIEVFWNASSLSGTNQLFGTYNTVGHSTSDSRVGGDYLLFQTLIGGSYYTAQYDPNHVTNTWYGNAYVYDRDNTTLCYEGGAQVATSLDLPNADIQEAGSVARYVTFGNNADSNNDFQGLMDEFRVSKIDRNNAWLKATYLTMSRGLQTYGAEELSDTTPTVTIISPSNSTYYNNFPNNVTFIINGTEATYNCAINVNGNVTYLGSVNNNTNKVWGIVKTDLLNKVNVTCLSLLLNGTATLYFTNQAHNTTTQNALTTYENIAYLFNLTVYANSDLINLSSVQSNLWFNDTVYNIDSRVQTNSSVTFSKTITMPLIEAYNVTKTGNMWNYNLTYYNSTVLLNSTNAFNTVIYQKWIGNCSIAGISILNISFKDEKTGTALDATMDSYFTIEAGGRNWTFSYENDTSFQFCAMPSWFNDTVDAEFSYGKTAYADRLYWLTGSRLDNITDYLTFYMLADASATSTTVRLIDNAGNGVPDYRIIARREFIGLGSFIAVASCVTDDSGYCGMALEWATPRYDFQVVNVTTGEVIKTTSPLVITSSNHPIQISINLLNIYSYWERMGTIMYNYTFTNSSTVYNFTVNAMDTSGLATSIKLDCYQVRVAGNALLSSETVSGYSASITCQLGNTTGYRYIMNTKISYSDGANIAFSESLDGTVPFTTSFDGLFAITFIIIELALAGLFSPVASIVFMILGLIVMSLLNVTSLKIETVVPIVLSGLIVAYILRSKRSD